MSFVKFPFYFSPAVSKICEYLDVSDIKKLSLVSKEWFSATSTSLAQRTCIKVKYCYYWKFLRKYLNISVEFDNINLYLVDFLKWYNDMNKDQKFSIKCLTLSTTGVIDVQTLRLVAELKSLESLILKAYRLIKLNDIVDTSLDLKEFRLEMTEHSEYCQDYIESICKSNITLKHFHSDIIDEKSFDVVAENCPEIESLSHLKIKINANTVKILSKLKNLKSLKISISETNKLSTLNFTKIWSLDLSGSFEYNDFSEFIQKNPNFIDLKLTIRELKHWEVLSLLAAYSIYLKSLKLLCDPENFIIQQHRPIFLKLERLEITNVVANDLLTTFSTPKIKEIVFHGILTSEEFRNLIKDDYVYLEDLTIQHLNIPEIDFCRVVKQLSSLKILNIYNCELFSDECLNVICKSQIQKANITALNFRSVNWWENLFQNKLAFNTEEKETSPHCCERILTCGERRIFLRFPKER
ncbi:hypothetical protein ACFFRR_009103 [Megaselia abdita]